MRVQEMWIAGCPFCGGEAVLDEPDEGEFYVLISHRGKCPVREWGVDGNLPPDGTLDEEGIRTVIELWNTRV